MSYKSFEHRSRTKPILVMGYIGYCSGDSTSGQRALYELGMTGIPIGNVNDNCSTGSTALYLAAQAIRGGDRGR